MYTYVYVCMYIYIYIYMYMLRIDLFSPACFTGGGSSLPPFGFQKGRFKPNLKPI